MGEIGSLKSDEFVGERARDLLRTLELSTSERRAKPFDSSMKLVTAEPTLIPPYESSASELKQAASEVEKLGDIGLTVKFDTLKLLKTSEWIWEKLGAKGEFYIITTVLDGSGKPFEYKTQHFHGLKNGDRLPLGDGGVLVSLLKNPKWFVDIHMLVMESDSNIRKIGAAIDKARKDSDLDSFFDAMKAASLFDATQVSRAADAVDFFLAMLAKILKANKDDHIATIHDFYLVHQGFGRGRHPSQGITKFQDVEAAYTIDLTKL